MRRRRRRGFPYTGMDGAVHEVWFEDVRSSLARFHLVKQYALRGLGYWNFMRPFTANFRSRMPRCGCRIRQAD